MRRLWGVPGAGCRVPRVEDVAIVGATAMTWEEHRWQTA